MLKLYCQKCGALNSYVSEKPNFCQKCGESFNGEMQKASQVQASQAQVVIEDDEPLPSNGLPDIQGLEVELASGRTSTDKLGTIMGTMAQGGSGDFGDSPIVPPNGVQYTMEDFKREAGSIKDQSINEEKT